MHRSTRILIGAAVLAAAIVGVQIALIGYRTTGTDPGAPRSVRTARPSATRQTAPGLPGGAQPLIRPGTPAPTAGHDGPPAITVSVETELFPETTGDNADDSAIWRNPDHPDRSLVLADDKSDHGGVGVYDLRGRQIHYERTGKIGNIDLRDDVRLGGRTVTLVGANDRSTGTIRLWALDHDQGTLRSLEARPLATLARNYGFCLGRSADRRHLYAFVSTEGAGTFEQYELRDASGRLDATKVRSVDVGSQTEGCVVDDATGAVYVGEEDVGIWQYDVDPATGPRRSSVDRVGDGRLTADVEGLAAARGPDGTGVLVASSQGDSTYAVYDLDGRHAFRGSFQVHGNGPVDGATETDGLAVAAGNFGPNYPNGLLVVHDGVNHDADGHEERCSDLKLARFDQVIALTPTA